jgi:hypothetical protein
MDLFEFSARLFSNSEPQPLQDSISHFISLDFIKFFLSLAKRDSSHQNTYYCTELDLNNDQCMERDRGKLMALKGSRSFSAVHGFSHFFRC